MEIANALVWVAIGQVAIVACLCVLIWRVNMWTAATLNVARAQVDTTKTVLALAELAKEQACS